MKVTPLGGALGAEIEGVDVRELRSQQVEDVYSALLEHEVIFFRDAGLDDEGHMALASQFGTPSVFPVSRVMGDVKPSFQVIRDGPDSEPAADYWHTDVTWTAEPPRAAFLRATLVPDRGGDTMWGSMSAAYSALSEKMQAFFDTLSVRHSNESFIAGIQKKIGKEASEQMAEKLREGYPPVIHPLVRTHPETGRRALLFGGRFMEAVVGLSASESESVLGFLRQHIDQPIFHTRWRWSEGDLAIWDERSTVHRALGDHFPRDREVRRCVIDGDRPFFREN